MKHISYPSSLATDVQRINNSLNFHSSVSSHSDLHILLSFLCSIQLHHPNLPVNMRLQIWSEATRLSQGEFLGLGLPHPYIPHLSRTAPPSISIRSLNCKRLDGDSSYSHPQPRWRKLSFPLPGIQRRRTWPLARDTRRPRFLHPA